MKKFIHLFLFVPIITFSQIGINTTTPNAILEIQSTNSGILIPRVQLTSILDNSTIINPAGGAIPTSTLVYNIAPSGVAPNNVVAGFYYWNSSQWAPIDGNSSLDHDWYKEGTSTAPTSITDNMFHTGNVAVGKNTANTTLDIFTNDQSIGINNKVYNDSNFENYIGINNEIDGTTSETSTGLFNNFTSTGSGSKIGFYNYSSHNNNGDKTGLYNQFANFLNSNIKGVNNYFQHSGNGNLHGMKNSFSDYNLSSNGFIYGIENTINVTSSSSTYGILNTINNSSGIGVSFGNKNNLSGAGSGTKYGIHTTIDASSGGNHFGVYSSVLKSGSSNFAGYFLGNVSIGTTDTNNYILPPSRGLDGQTMQTDAVGNISWVNSVKQAAIKIKPSANITSFTNTGEASLLFNNILFNNGGGTYNTSTGAYTIPYSGVYNFQANISWSFVGSSATRMINRFRIYVNGVMQENITHQFDILNAGYLQNYPFHSTLNLTKDDIVTFRLFTVWGIASPSPYIDFNASNISIFKVY